MILVPLEIQRGARGETELIRPFIIDRYVNILCPTSLPDTRYDQFVSYSHLIYVLSTYVPSTTSSNRHLLNRQFFLICIYSPTILVVIIIAGD